jgi:ribose transport system permease protein
MSAMSKPKNNGKVKRRGDTLIGQIQEFLLLNSQIVFTIVVAFGIATFFALRFDSYASDRNIFAILERFPELGLITLGLTVTIIAGEIDLSVGSVAATVGVIVVRLNDPLGAIPALLIGVAIATAFGALQGLLIRILNISAIVFTVGTLMLLRGLSLFIADEQTVVLRDFAFGDFLKDRITFGENLELFVSAASVIALLVFVAVGIFLMYHKWAREIYAIGGARREAVAAGVPLTRPLVITFAISAFCAGLAGAIIGLRSGSAQPLGLQQLLLTGTTAAFVGGVSISGGKGSAFGAALGTITIALLEIGLIFMATPAYVARLAVGTLLVVVIIVELGAQWLDRYQTRRALLEIMDERRELLQREPSAAGD